jgi:hypothetical protein
MHDQRRSNATKQKPHDAQIKSSPARARRAVVPGYDSSRTAASALAASKIGCHRRVEVVGTEESKFMRLKEQQVPSRVLACTFHWKRLLFPPAL